VELLKQEYQNQATQIFDQLLKLGNFNLGELGNFSYHEIPLYNQLSQLCEQQKKLTFILPAFPAKSSNPEKTSGVLPDLGELIGLITLDQFCCEISKIYLPGAEVIICSDGRVFNDLVFVSDEHLQQYKNSINHIIKSRNFNFLKTYDLEDYYNCQTFNSMRQIFCLEHADDLDKVKSEITADEQSQQLFNGIHRFLKEDMLSLKKEMSKNQICKKSKDLAYKVVQRSRAWDNLLKTTFPETLRLSIHPYPLSHHKFGIKLVPSSHRWATPWHNVVIKQGDHFELIKKRQAIEMGAIEKKWGGEYVYFEAP